MNKINLTEISIEKNRSPKGQFRRLSQHISQAVAGVNGLGSKGISLPFEVDLVRIPAGAINWPFHSHSVKWELYMIISGRGQVRTQDRTVDVREGDCIVHPPGGASNYQYGSGGPGLLYHRG